MRHPHLWPLTVVATGAATVALGCIHHQTAAVPLYDPAAPSRSAQPVARLYGPIASVDGRDVQSLGGPFDLPPGCHVVVTRKQMLDLSQPDAVPLQFSPVTFALRMKPAHAYVIEPPERKGGQAGAPVMAAHEEAPDGTRTRIGPTESDQIIAGCRDSDPG
jgi:hypothetical protein